MSSGGVVVSSGGVVVSSGGVVVSSGGVVVSAGGVDVSVDVSVGAGSTGSEVHATIAGISPIASRRKIVCFFMLASLSPLPGMCGWLLIISLNINSRLLP